MIKTSRGFQYSINIKYDANSHEKISSYIPTDRSVALLEQLMESLNTYSNDRARIVVGAYGTGKSHLLAVIAAMLKQQLRSETFEPILQKIEGLGKEELSAQLKNQFSNKPFLVVFINGNHNNLQQNFTQGLVEAIKEAEIDIKPNTAYYEIEKMIAKWANYYPETYNTMRSYLKENYNLDENDFKNMILDCHPRAYEIFVELYPILTSGASFNPFHIDNIAELYEDVAHKIKSSGYKGIYVVFDEFNKHLEAAIKNKELIDLKPLQDFAEMCNRSDDNQVHLTLISHQHISQYASKLSHDLINEWRKVEGRFSIFELQNQSSLIYSLISNVIIKESHGWNEFLKQNKEEFEWLKQKTLMKGLFKELTEQQVEDWVIKGCYPLHPCTTFCLPKLSNKVAQNERSIFTFLATNDYHSLGRFLETRDHSYYNLLTMDSLFDYFSTPIKKSHSDDAMYKSWIKASEAINKLTSDDELGEKIIKTLGIVIGLREERLFPPTSQMIKFALSMSENDEAKLENKILQLAKEKIIYIRKSDNKIQFFSGSDEDFGAAINRVKSTYSHFPKFNVSKILNDYFTPYPVIANRYNDKFEMTRYFTPEYYTAKELTKGVDWEKKLIENGYLDGLVILVVPETEQEIIEVKEYVTQINNDQIIFVLPRIPLQIAEDAYDYLALQLLAKDQEFLSKSPLVEVELNAYLDDYYEKLEEDLSLLINPQSNEALYYYKGHNVPINSSARLSQLVSTACENVFNKTPLINNEMINKTNITATISKARKKLNHRIIFDDSRENIGLTGHGPDMSIFRSIIKRTGLYQFNEQQASANISKETANQDIIHVLSEIEQWLQSTIEYSKDFSFIYDVLRKPPYGVRPGIIPILLAICLKEYKETLIIKNKHGMEEPLSADLLELIDKSAYSYTARLEDWAEIKEVYIQNLSNLFEKYMESFNEYSANKIYPVAAGMKNWFISLPKYTRETKKIGNNGLSLQKALNNPSQDSKQLLFDNLPSSYNISLRELSDNTRVADFMYMIEKGKRELDNHIYNKVLELNNLLIEIFDSKSINNCYEAVEKWYYDLDSATKNHLFDEITNRFIKLIVESSDTSKDVFIKESAYMITGLNLENWNDFTLQDFVQQICSIKEKIESHNRLDPTNNNFVKIQLLDNNSNGNEISFEKTDITPLGKTLHNTIEAQLNAYAESIPANEKRQILLDLILKLS